MGNIKIKGRRQLLRFIKEAEGYHIIKRYYTPKHLNNIHYIEIPITSPKKWVIAHEIQNAYEEK